MNAEEREQLKREDCRAMVLGYLADRPHVAQSAETIRRCLEARAIYFETEEIRDACLYWEGIQNFKRHYPAGSNTPHWQVTTEGINTRERSRV